MSGKGVGAAIYMAVSRTLLHATALENLGAAECLEHLNALLCLDTESGMFVTVCYGILDVQTGELEYATGGHPPPFLVGRSGARALELAGGLVIGMMEDIEFGVRKATLAPGDFLVFYSDGVNEAMDDQLEQFSIERLGEFLGQVQASSAEEMSKAIIAEVRRYAGTAPQADDITVLTLGYRGAGD